MPILDSGDGSTPAATTESTDQGDGPDGPKDNVDERESVEGATPDVNELIGEGTGMSFGEAMEAVTGESPDAETEDETDSSSEEGETEAIPESEQEETEKPDDTKDEEPEGEEDQAETSDTDEEEEEPEQEVDPVDELVNEIESEFDDVQVETTDDVIEELRRERQGNDALVELADHDSRMLDFMGDALKQLQSEGEANLDELASDYFDTDLPDPEEDREAYEKAVRERERRRNQRENSRAELERLAQDVKEMADTAETSVEKVIEDEGLEGDEAKAFRKRVAEFVNEPDEDFARAVYLLENHEAIVEQEREEAFKEGKNEGIEERRSKDKGDGVANLRSSETTSKEETEEPENENAAKTLEVVQSGNSNPLEEITE